MIYDIKVFDKHGQLKEIINGTEIFAKVYGDEGSQSPYLMDRKKTKVTFICRFCKGEFPRHSASQFCCKQEKCKYQRALIRKPLKGGRKIKCSICDKETIVKHSRALTCSPECSAERNRRNNLINGLSFRVKERKRKKKEQLRKETSCQV